MHECNPGERLGGDLTESHAVAYFAEDLRGGRVIAGARGV
jgi:hypothetical protein